MPQVDPEAEAVAWAFDPDRAKWAALGVHDRADVDLLAADGISYFNYREWFDCGFTVAECLAWELRMFVPSVAALWEAEGCSPAEAREWVMVTGDTTRDGPAKSKPWRTYFTVEEALRWRKEGLSAEEAAACAGKLTKPGGG